MSALLRPTEEGAAYVPLAPGDIEEVMATETRLYPYPWTRGNFNDALLAGYSSWVLRSTEGHLLAYALMMLALDEAHLLNLTVALAGQRRGLGWGTLEWMAKTARSHGARTMLLEVRPSNVAALRLYRRYGFEQIGVRRGYYPAQAGREDAVVMRIAL